MPLSVALSPRSGYAFYGLFKVWVADHRHRTMCLRSTMRKSIVSRTKKREGNTWLPCNKIKLTENGHYYFVIKKNSICISCLFNEHPANRLKFEKSALAVELNPIPSILTSNSSPGIWAICSIFSLPLEFIKLMANSEIHCRRWAKNEYHQKLIAVHSHSSAVRVACSLQYTTSRETRGKKNSEDDGEGGDAPIRYWRKLKFAEINWYYFASSSSSFLRFFYLRLRLQRKRNLSTLQM